MVLINTMIHQTTGIHPGRNTQDKRVLKIDKINNPNINQRVKRNGDEIRF